MFISIDQNCTAAVNATLLAYAAYRRAAAAPLLLGPDRAAIDRYLPPAGPTAANQSHVAASRSIAETNRHIDGQMVRRTPYRYVDPAACHASDVNNCMSIVYWFPVSEVIAYICQCRWVDRETRRWRSTEWAARWRRTDRQKKTRDHRARYHCITALTTTRPGTSVFCLASRCLTANCLTNLRSGWKRDTAHICCWTPCCCGYGSKGGRACCRRAVQQSIDIACRGSHSSKPAARCCSSRIDRLDRQTDRQTDGRKVVSLLCDQCQHSPARVLLCSWSKVAVTLWYLFLLYLFH